jgi:uncharacterized lipoprotein NlpE involved in copper resistance
MLRQKNLLNAGLLSPKMRINDFKAVKTYKMKKIFALMLVAGSLVACNNEANKSESDVQDSVQKTIDSIGDARVDSVKEATDSLQQKVENTFEKTDSANKALADTTKR